jgi:hypothetical protein
MDFLEDLFERNKRKRQNQGGLFQNSGHHDDDHDDDHDHDHDHGHHQQYPANQFPQPPANPVAFQPGVLCRNCLTPTVTGAKFCHGCGKAIEMVLNCASCGSKLPANALFCPQCGYKGE